MINALLKMNDNLRIGLLMTGMIISFFLTCFTGPFWFIFITLMFTFLGLLIYTNLKATNNYVKDLKQSLVDTLKEHNFNSDDYYGSCDFLTGIAINKENQKLALLERNNKDDKYKLREIDFDDLLEVSVYEDGGIVTKVSRGSQVGGALIGGAIAGGTGAIIGGLSGKSQSNDMSNRLSLLLIIDDLENPYHELNFSSVQLEKSSDLYVKVRKDMYKWFGILKVIINQNENS